MLGADRGRQRLGDRLPARRAEPLVGRPEDERPLAAVEVRAILVRDRGGQGVQVVADLVAQPQEVPQP